MSEDKLLEQLAQHARTAPAPDGTEQAWEALAAGELSADERLKLIEQDPDGERKALAFDPLPVDFRDALAADLKAALPSDSTLTVAAPPGKRTSRWLGALAASLVAAVALMTLLPGGERGAPLPGYDATVRGGSVMRSENDERAVFSAGDRVEFILTPATSVETPLEIVAFLQHADGLEPLSLPLPQWSEFGAARLVAAVGENLPLRAGDNVLLVAVARSGALPSRADVVRRLSTDQGGEPSEWQLLRFELRVEEP